QAIQRQSRFLRDLADGGRFRRFALLDVPLGKAPASAGLDQGELLPIAARSEDDAAGRKLSPTLTGLTQRWHPPNYGHARCPCRHRPRLARHDARWSAVD